MEITYKNTKYTFQFGYGQGHTRGVLILGGISILMYLMAQTNRQVFNTLLGFVPSYAIGKLMLWQFVTANFMHASLTHLCFNMVALYMFRSAVEKAFKERELIKYFLICGAGGYALVCLLWLFGAIPNGISLDASAGLYGLLLAFSLLYPHQQILLFFILPVQARWLALIFASLEFLLMFRNDGISHIGHLGGAAIGLLYFVRTRGIIFVQNALKA